MGNYLSKCRHLLLQIAQLTAHFGQPSKRGDLLHCLFVWHGWTAEHDLAGFDVLHDAGLCADDDFVSDVDMVFHANLTSHHDVIASGA